MKNIQKNVSANSNITTARSLTLEEIEDLPFASVVWMCCTHNDNGVIWHWKKPVVVGAAGRYGAVMGGDEDGIIIRKIDEDMLADQSETYWTQEPDDSQVPGITEEEYNADPNEENIVCVQLAEAITGRKVTFRRICEQTGIDLREFMAKMNGKKGFTCRELLAIAHALGTTVDELFFPGLITQI